MPAFQPYSETTAELLARARANAAAQPGTAGYEAAREHVLKNLVTSDRLPIPSPGSSASKRGRGRGRGKGGAARSARSPADSTPGSVSTPVTDRARGKVGRPRGRGRGGGGRGGKRKRSESIDESDVSIPRALRDALGVSVPFLRGHRRRIGTIRTGLIRFRAMTLTCPIPTLPSRQSRNLVVQSTSPQHSYLSFPHQTGTRRRGDHIGETQRLRCAKHANEVTVQTPTR